jgi:hypothetical protein
LLIKALEVLSGSRGQIWLPGKIRKADTQRKNDYGDFQAQLSFIGSSLGSKAPHADIL